MKYCFFINEFIFFKEFWWKVAQQAAREGDECIFLIDGKIAEYGKKEYFVKPRMKFISKVDWCVEHYDKNKKDFGGLSWKEFFSDFVRYEPLTFNYENAVETTSQLYQFLDFVFQNEKPDAVIAGNQADLFEQVAYYLAKKHKVPWLAIMESILGEGRIDVFDFEHTNSQFKPTFEKLKIGDISKTEREFTKNFLERFLLHKQKPSYMRDQVVYSSLVKLFCRYIQRLKKFNEKKDIFFKYLYNRERFKKYDYRSDLTFRQFARTPLKDIKRQFFIFSQKHFFQFYNNKDENFFLYPLHFQPEFTTSVLATYYADQAATVRNIAFALPFPYKLYVKEHPSSPGTRPSEFYKKIQQIPNVVLISAKERVENLIKMSAGIITLSGTVGMEAALTGKPVYILGKVFYMYHPLCRKVENFDDLKNNIQADIVHKPHVADLESVNTRFIISYFRNTIAGGVIAGASDNEPNEYGAILKDLKTMLKR